MYFPAVTELPTESAQVFKNKEQRMFFGALTSVQPELIHLMKNNEELRFSLANLTQLNVEQAAAIQDLTSINRMGCEVSKHSVQKLLRPWGRLKSRTSENWS